MSQTIKSLHNTSRYPTSLIIRGSDSLGIEIAKSLLEQGGYVILIDSEENGRSEKLDELKKFKLLTILDFSAISILEDELRRLDYVFYLQHRSTDFTEKISTQEFLQFSNYLDTILDLTAKFEAKFLLTTSVRAHQMILASKQLDFNYNAGVVEQHTIYNELEVQRYAESLVHEYQEKVGIDTRTLRLGELLGKDIEINYGSNVTKAIIQALKGEEIKLPGDGLESDFYIHYLDAAYGILKAQFSLNTKGKIYTLSNEEEISLLSIAYKLLDLVPTAHEVGFTDETGALPPIKMYKSAPNLINIGWKPRVNFERALTQTITHIQNVLLQNGLNKKIKELGSKSKKSKQTDKKNRTIKEKITDFFFKTEEVDENDSSENLEGALSRLVAERKMQESSRKGSIILANTMLRGKTKKTDKRGSNKFLKGVENTFMNRFNFLKNITIYDFIISTLGLIAFLIIYFMILAPALSLGKNLFMIKVNADSIQNSMAAYKIDDSRRFATTIKDNAIDAQIRLDELEFMFEVIDKKDQYIIYQEFLTNFVEYSSGLEEVLMALEPVSEYLEHFDPGIQYTFSNANLLTLSNQQDFSELIGEISYKESLIVVGAKRLEKSKDALIEGFDGLPDFLKNDYQDSFVGIEDVYNEYAGIAENYKYLPDILGGKKSRKILFVVQDNVRYNAGGGAIAGFIQIEIKNGALVNINVIESDPNETLISYPSGFLQKVNLLSNEEIKATTVTVNDIGYLLDERDYFEALELYAYDQLNIESDFIVAFNLKSMEQILLSSGEIEFQQFNLNMDNMISNINLLVPPDTSIDVRNELLLQLAAKLLERELNNLKTSYPSTIQLFSLLREEDNMRIYTSREEFAGLVDASYAFNVYDDYVSFGVNVDTDVASITKYASTNIELKVYMDAELQTEKELLIDSNGVFSFANTFGCVPLGSKNLSYIGVPNELVTPTFSDDRVCSIFLPQDDSEYTLKFDTVAFDYTLENGYNYNLVINKIPGIDSSYYIEFEFAPELQVEPLDEGYSLQGSKYIYSGYFIDDYLDFNFNIE